MLARGQDVAVSERGLKAVKPCQNLLQLEALTTEQDTDSNPIRASCETGLGTDLREGVVRRLRLDTLQDSENVVPIIIALNGCGPDTRRRGATLDSDSQGEQSHARSSPQVPIYCS